MYVLYQYISKLMLLYLSFVDTFRVDMRQRRESSTTNVDKNNSWTSGSNNQQQQLRTTSAGSSNNQSITNRVTAGPGNNQSVTGRANSTGRQADYRDDTSFQRNRTNNYNNTNSNNNDRYNSYNNNNNNNNRSNNDDIYLSQINVLKREVQELLDDKSKLSHDNIELNERIGQLRAKHSSEIQATREELLRVETRFLYNNKYYTLYLCNSVTYFVIINIIYTL